MRISEIRYYQFSLLLPVAVVMITVLWGESINIAPEIMSKYHPVLGWMAPLFGMAIFILGIPYLAMCFIIIMRSIKYGIGVIKKDLKLSPLYLIGLGLSYNLIIPSIMHGESGIAFWMVSIPFSLVFGYVFVLIVFGLARLIYK